MKKIIVTGGSFIGSNLVNFQEKFFVINLDKLTYASNSLKNNLRNKNYKLIKVIL